MKITINAQKIKTISQYVAIGIILLLTIPTINKIVFGDKDKTTEAMLCEKQIEYVVVPADGISSADNVQFEYMVIYNQWYEDSNKYVTNNRASVLVDYKVDTYAKLHKLDKALSDKYDDIHEDSFITHFTLLGIHSK